MPATLHRPREPRRYLPDGSAVIELTLGYETIIDASDVDFVCQHLWCIWRSKKHDTKYARCGVGWLHRALVRAPAGVLVDHRDGDGLNNRRRNLRLSSHAGNSRNRRAWSGRAFKGVFKVRGCSRFKAQIRAGSGVHLYLGCFLTEIEAAMAYDEAAVRYHGDFARLNFPAEVAP